jgi:hypothetical protein
MTTTATVYVATVYVFGEDFIAVGTEPRKAQQALYDTCLAWVADAHRLGDAWVSLADGVDSLDAFLDYYGGSATTVQLDGPASRYGQG